MDNIKCDECNEMIEIAKIKSKKVGIYRENQVRFSYFACQKCKAKYFVGVKEKEYNKMIAKLRQLQKKIRALIGSGDVDELEKLHREQRQLQLEIEAYSEMLKGLFVLK